MSDLAFEWGGAKAAANLRRRGVSFQEAVTVCSDERGWLLDDLDHSAGEDRFVLLRLSSRLRTLVVAHCYREAPDTIRLISARKATRPERALYEARWRP